MSDGSARRAELAAFLRARRAKLQPSDVGLVTDAYGTRRTPGLRREEVAELAGVSLTWYTWLEQGRDISTSAQVIDALARALLLDTDDRRHLRTLADLPAPDAQPTDPPEVPSPRLQRLVDAAMPNVACVYDAHLDYLAWNAAYAKVRHDPATLAPGRRNLLWFMFAEAGERARLARWEPAARAVLSQFRASSDLHPRGAQLVEELSAASAEFRAWWAEYPVRSFRPATIQVRHPGVGEISLEMFQLRLVEDPDLLMVLQVPAGEADRARVAALLG
ncbi:MAG: helix-turn-helix domain-containing protein [Thermoactinospora sp.]|nr:helix-turn-helix domain-containing protein [Thermoactinospora sp.]